MGKHHVKNDPTHPKNDPSHKPRSDPSNDEYITVLKKVTFDSLVEFFPPQTQISPSSREVRRNSANNLYCYILIKFVVH